MRKIILYIFLFFFSYAGHGQCDMEIAASKGTLSCYGDCNGSVELFLTGGTTPYNFAWNSTSNNSAIIAGLCAGNYAVTITDAGVCDTTMSFEIIQPEKIIISTTVTNSDCEGNKASILTKAQGGYSPYVYQWQSGPASSSYTGLSSGTYTLVVFDIKSCSESASISVTSVPQLKLNHSVVHDVCDLLGHVSFYADSGTTPYTFYFDGSVTTESIVEDLDAGEYILEVIDAKGCSDTANITIQEIACSDPVPDLAFTPNGDGINDTWHIKYIEQYPNCSLVIYDRWGQKVLNKRNGYDPPWRGNNNTLDLPAGVYYYILQKDSNDKSQGVISGSVTLVR